MDLRNVALSVVSVLALVGCAGQPQSGSLAELPSTETLQTQDFGQQFPEGLSRVAMAETGIALIKSITQSMSQKMEQNRYDSGY